VGLGHTEAMSEDPSMAPLIEHLLARRAEPARDGVPPTGEQLATILKVATRVPDHGALRPWRFVVIEGSRAKAEWADAMESGLRLTKGPELPESVVAKMRGKTEAAPCSVMVVSSPEPESNIEVWEQEASAACTGYAIVLAATALGLGAIWKSAKVLDAPPVRECFALAGPERLLGWINIGSPEVPKERRGFDEAGRPAPPVTYLAGS